MAAFVIFCERTRRPACSGVGPELSMVETLYRVWPCLVLSDWRSLLINGVNVSVVVAVFLQQVVDSQGGGVSRPWWPHTVSGHRRLRLPCLGSLHPLSGAELPAGCALGRLLLSGQLFFSSRSLCDMGVLLTLAAGPRLPWVMHLRGAGITGRMCAALSRTWAWSRNSAVVFQVCVCDFVWLHIQPGGDSVEYYFWECRHDYV